jgi:hypothetical protein
MASFSRRPQCAFAPHGNLALVTRASGMGHVAARSKRTRRNVALYLCAKARLFDRVYFIAGGRALDRGQRMLELWNNWSDTLASVEALATVIVIVLVAAGAITLAESRRR